MARRGKGFGRVAGVATASLALTACAPAEPPAGPVAAPVTTVNDDPSSGIESRTVEVDPPGPGATSESTRAAEELRARVVAAVEGHGWRDLDRARRDGFRPLSGAREHWINQENLRDGRTFDADRPEFLVLDRHAALGGVMFVSGSDRLDLPPPPGAPTVRWHYHRWSRPLCLSDGIVATRVPDDGLCRDGEAPTDRSGLMVHVWVKPGIDPFAAGLDDDTHHH